VEEITDLTFNYYLILAGVTVFAFLLNLPFGFLRHGTRKYSLQWFLYIHLPVPFVYFSRKMFSLKPSAILPLVVASILGQVLGGKYSERRGVKYHEEE
jgi:hypothetical protein